MNEYAQALLSLSDQAFDPAAKRLVERWSDPPAAQQVLEVLDLCVNGSLCSSFEIRVLQHLYDAACHREGVAHGDVISEAPWRKGRI